MMHVLLVFGMPTTVVKLNIVFMAITKFANVKLGSHNGSLRKNNIDRIGLSNMLLMFGPQYLVTDIHQDYGSSVATKIYA